MIPFDAVHARTRRGVDSRPERPTLEVGQPPFAEQFAAERRAADRGAERSDRTGHGSRVEHSSRTEVNEPTGRDHADAADRLESRDDARSSEPDARGNGTTEHRLSVTAERRPHGHGDVGGEHERVRPLNDDSAMAEPATSSYPIPPLVPLRPAATMGRPETDAAPARETSGDVATVDAASPHVVSLAAVGVGTALAERPSAVVATNATGVDVATNATGVDVATNATGVDVTPVAPAHGLTSAGAIPPLIATGVEAPTDAQLGERPIVTPIDPNVKVPVGATVLSVSRADQRALAVSVPAAPLTASVAIATDPELPTEAALTAVLAQAEDGPNSLDLTMRLARSAPSHSVSVGPSDAVDQGVLGDAATPVDLAPPPDVATELATVEPGSGSGVTPVVDETVVIDDVVQPEPTLVDNTRGADAAAPSSAKSTVYRAAEITAIKEMFEQVDRQRLAATGSIEVEIQTERFGPIRVEALDAGEGVQLQLRSNGDGGDDLRDLARQLQHEFDSDDDAGGRVVVADGGHDPDAQTRPLAGFRDSGVDVQL